MQVQGKAVNKPGVTWDANPSHLNDATSAANKLNLKGVSTMSWWVDADQPWGSIGIAWVTALCNGAAVNLNEKQPTAAESGSVSRSFVVKLHLCNMSITIGDN